MVWYGMYFCLYEQATSARTRTALEVCLPYSPTHSLTDVRVAAWPRLHRAHPRAGEDGGRGFVREGRGAAIGGYLAVSQK